MTTGTQPNLDEMTVSDLHRFCKDNAIPGHWSNNLRGRDKLINYIKKFLEVSQTGQEIEPTDEVAPGVEAVEENTAEQLGSENHANTFQTPEAWLDSIGFRSHFSDNLSQPAARWGKWAMWEAFTTQAKTRYVQVLHLSSNKCWHIFWQDGWHSFRDAARFLTNVICVLEPVVVIDASYCEVPLPAPRPKPPTKTRTPKLMLCLLGALLVGQIITDCDHRGSECRRWVEVPG